MGTGHIGISDIALVPVGLGGGGGSGGGFGVMQEQDVVLSDLFGGTCDVGTVGECYVRWWEGDPLTYIQIYISLDDDATFGNGGPFLIRSDSLPFAIEGGIADSFGSGGTYSQPGAFGFMADAAGTTFGEMAVPVATSTGGILFVNVPGTTGIDSLVSGTNPQALTGVQTRFQAAIMGVTV